MSSNPGTRQLDVSFVKFICYKIGLLLEKIEINCEKRPVMANVKTTLK